MAFINGMPNAGPNDRFQRYKVIRQWSMTCLIDAELKGSREDHMHAEALREHVLRLRLEGIGFNRIRDRTGCPYITGIEAMFNLAVFRSKSQLIRKWANTPRRMSKANREAMDAWNAAMIIPWLNSGGAV